ncbi:YceD family protein [Parvularcula sp. IMCC14364]|uniref:YceD family protein n=1 Tax=Parvularcula sp. IMCC14364 TaxID=3067902 RepID=UPI002740C1FB|nr:YceD family protein [Parvularcula sp. IMCC14364]
MTQTTNAKGSRTVVPLSDLDDLEKSYRIELSPTQLHEAANRLDIPDIETLEIDFHISKTGPLIGLRGTMKSVLKRICVVTLDTMEEKLNVDFSIDYTTEALPDSIGDEEISLEEDEPEPLESESLDLLDIAVQQLALEMTQYPRKDGAELPSEGRDDRNLSPFSVLKSN